MYQLPITVEKWFIEKTTVYLIEIHLYWVSLNVFTHEWDKHIDWMIDWFANRFLDWLVGWLIDVIIYLYLGSACRSGWEACDRKAAEGRLPGPGEGRPQEEGGYSRQDQCYCQNPLSKINWLGRLLRSIFGINS